MSKRKISLTRAAVRSPVIEQASLSESSDDDNRQELPSNPFSLSGCDRCHAIKTTGDNHVDCFLCTGCSPRRTCSVCQEWDNNTWMAVYFGVSDSTRPKKAVPRPTSNLTSGGKVAVSGMSSSMEVSLPPVCGEAGTRASLLSPRSVLAKPPDKKAVKKSHVGGKGKNIPTLHTNAVSWEIEGNAPCEAGPQTCNTTGGGSYLQKQGGREYFSKKREASDT